MFKSIITSPFSLYNSVSNTISNLFSRQSDWEDLFSFHQLVRYEIKPEFIIKKDNNTLEIILKKNWIIINQIDFVLDIDKYLKGAKTIKYFEVYSIFDNNKKDKHTLFSHDNTFFINNNWIKYIDNKIIISYKLNEILKFKTGHIGGFKDDIFPNSGLITINTPYANIYLSIVFNEEIIDSTFKLYQSVANLDNDQVRRYCQSQIEYTNVKNYATISITDFTKFDDKNNILIENMDRILNYTYIINFNLYGNFDYEFIIECYDNNNELFNNINEIKFLTLKNKEVLKYENIFIYDPETKKYKINIKTHLFNYNIKIDLKDYSNISELKIYYKKMNDTLLTTAGLISKKIEI